VAFNVVIEHQSHSARSGSRWGCWGVVFPEKLNAQAYRYRSSATRETSSIYSSYRLQLDSGQDRLDVHDHDDAMTYMAHSPFVLNVCGHDCSLWYCNILLGQGHGCFSHCIITPSILRYKALASTTARSILLPTSAPSHTVEENILEDYHRCIGVSTGCNLSNRFCRPRGLSFPQYVSTILNTICYNTHFMTIGHNSTSL
jgi:hypothetical protein